MVERWLEDVKKTGLTDRGLSDYLDELEISEKDLNKPGSLILDLGSGEAQEFAREAAEKGLKCRIVSVDPGLALNPDEDLQRCLYRMDRMRGKLAVEGSLAAVSNDLPFKTGCFNLVCAMWSIPMYLLYDEDIERSLAEILRVTADGGRVRISPVLTIQRDAVNSFLSCLHNIRYRYSGGLLKIEKRKSKSKW